MAPLADCELEGDVGGEIGEGKQRDDEARSGVSEVSAGLDAAALEGEAGRMDDNGVAH